MEKQTLKMRLIKHRTILTAHLASIYTRITCEVERHHSHTK